MGFNFNKFDKYDWACAILLAVFFVGSSYLAWGTSSFGSLRFNSPDETGNYFFISQFAQHWSLSVPEPLNSIAPVVHPRSVNVSGTNLVPGSFTGVALLYGLLAKLTGLYAVLYFTPLFVCLSLAVLYSIIRKYFDSQTALLSVFLIAIFPGLTYNTARGLLPNALFIVGLILFLSAVASLPLARSRFVRVAITLGAGFFLSLSVAVRLNEIIWIVPLVVAIGIYFRRNFSWSDYVFVFISAALFFLPVLYFNKQTFSGYFQTGYGQLVSESVTEAPTIKALATSSTTIQITATPPSPVPAKNFIQSYIFPLGLNFSLTAKNFYNYFLRLFWPLTLPATLALLYFFSKWRDLSRFERFYLAAGLLVSCWLVIYYGSVRIIDSTLPGPTIGTSYVRYWLPLYLWLIVGATIAVRKIQDYRLWIVAALLAIWGTNLTFLATPESLFAVKTNLGIYHRINENVQAVTLPDSVIITYRTDKIFFPQRKVIHAAPGDNFYVPYLPQLLVQTQVYLFSTQSRSDIEYFVQSHLRPMALKLEKVGDFDNFGLYQFLVQ